MKEPIKINSIDKSSAGKTVEIYGWIDTIRDHGGVFFADIRNRSGIIQAVFDVSKKSARFSEETRKLRAEFVVFAKGEIALRPQESVNPKIPTGEIELRVEEFEILNLSKPLPFFPGERVTEETKLKYRFLDLRSPKMLENLSSVAKIMEITRQHFSSLGFMEILTPFLTRSTPEGARDYLVPSRVNPGNFYALPQSPQLFKQILMSGGIERYYQIARCFRDEDLRADRQPEFTQIDMEMSFVSSEDVMEVIWDLVEKIFSQFRISLSRPEIVPYEKAIFLYGTDKPDLRVKIMPMKDVSEIFSTTAFRVFRSIREKGGKIAAFFVEKEFSRAELDGFVNFAKKLGAGGLVWMKKENGELKSPVAKFLSDKEKNSLLAFASGRGTLFMAGGDNVFMVMGELRLFIAKKYGFMKNGFFPVWVVEAPLFEKGKDGKISSVHHPFTAPLGDVFKQNPLELKSFSYDLVINGEELGGGSVRIHRAEIQRKVFEILGMTEREYLEKFGFLLDALSYGCPPHGGFAFGLERLAAMILGLDSIRDVIAFPKTQNAVCPLTGAPGKVSDRQLKELGLKTAL